MEKVEENSKYSLTDIIEALQCPSRNTSGVARKGSQFFQLLGLQIELNLVPTMKCAPRGVNFMVGAEIEFFVARKPGWAVIFESLILEFVTRLRKGRRKPAEAE